jgi:adenylate cyclase class 2
LEHRETEIKLKLDASVPRTAARLRSLGATLHRPRHFEDNFILEDSGGKLRRAGSLLRVRLTPAAAFLTFKGPRRIVGGTKEREEIEMEIQDGPHLLKILGRSGMKCTFRYQKYRTIYRHASVLITLDETPIGNYMELEGPRGGIARFARRLGFGREDFITETYHGLFVSYRKANHIKFGNMLFGIDSPRGLRRAMDISMGGQSRGHNRRGFQSLSPRRRSSRRYIPEEI